MWVTTADLPTAASHPFCRRLNQLLREHGFGDFVAALCAGFYAETMRRPGLPPGIYFRLLLIGNGALGSVSIIALRRNRWASPGRTRSDRNRAGGAKRKRGAGMPVVRPSPWAATGPDISLPPSA